MQTMSIESLALVPSPIEAAKAAVDAARRELAAVDQRIAGYEGEVEAREIAAQEHRIAMRAAVLASAPLPKPLKQKLSEAETALPILRGKRTELAKRVGEAEGNLRRACVLDVERRFLLSQDAFAQAAGQLIEAWRGLIGVHALLEQAGVTSHPLPNALMGNFTIPAMGKLRPICENHWAHFAASHALDQGAMSRSTHATRLVVERDIGMTLPW